MRTLTRASSGPRAVEQPRDGLRDKERAENFPVAMRILPRRYREALRAVYDVVRVIDDIGDTAAGDRTALLDDFERDLASAWRGGSPRHPCAARLVPFVAARGLSEEPFRRLIEANRMDQTVSRYATFDDVLHYCSLSAAPIGHLVLEIFGASNEADQKLSDCVCMALQLLEHWQDVAEDHRMGRIYLPQDEMAACGVTSTDLETVPTPLALRRLIGLETERAADLLEAGRPLVARLNGWSKLAVAGYVAGGRATVDALARAGGDVMAGPPRPRRTDVARHLVTVLWAARR
jgi:squalene synthase HpnC